LPDGIAVITGGGRGIGASIARSLAGDGFAVVVTARSRAQIDTVANETGGRAVEMDVSSRESVERGFASIGHVDLLVANAGIGDNALEIPVFVISPGLVRTALTEGNFADDAPWTPPELAPELVRKLATGRYDALAGRYIHAEHDDVDDLLARVDEIREDDLNAIRLRR
jgi:hypothetical protein